MSDQVSSNSTHNIKKCGYCLRLGNEDEMIGDRWGYWYHPGCAKTLKAWQLRDPDGYDKKSRILRKHKEDGPDVEEE